MLDASEFDRWMGEARRALRSARVQADEDLHNWACFAAEQAAQLAIKALLHGVGAGPWGHDLVELGAKAKEAAGELWPDVEDPLTRLSRHYIPARYPDAHPAGGPGEHYTASDARTAVDDAETILESVETAWEQLREAGSDDG